MSHMPAEWEPHESVWMAWPYDKISFGSLNRLNGEFDPSLLTRVEGRFAEIITQLAKSESVELLVRRDQKHSHILQNVRILENVKVHEASYADVWTRDYAPSFVVSELTPSLSLVKERQLKAVKWDYDAYSKKFPTLIKDNEVFDNLLLISPSRGGEIRIVKPGIIMEGGAIEVNGQGTLLTTEQCLLARNGGKISKEQYEKYFADYLGITKTIWLKEGIAGDHTDGHIDEVARFVTPNKVVCAYEDDKTDENYVALNDVYESLKGQKGSRGEELEIIKLPMPHVRYSNGEKAPASYANFFIGNSAVLIPKFNDPNDEKAFEIIKSHFPGREAVSIDCSEMIYGGGSIHCATREVPSPSFPSVFPGRD